MRMRKLIVIAVLAVSVAAYAEQFGQRRFGGGRNFGPSGGQCLVPGYRGGDGTEDGPKVRKNDGSIFVYARIRYHAFSWWREGTNEIPWHHDYPDGDNMFPVSLDRLTKVHTAEQAFEIVDIDSPDLFKYPFTYLSEPGYLDLKPNDVKNLREYYDRGGFTLIDDFRGNESDNSEYENTILQLKKIFPDRELTALTPDHPIFHVVFDTEPQNMLPPYRMRNSGDPRFLAITDAKGNIQVMIDFNNDMSEYWQALDVGACSIHEAGTAVQLGINYGIYALTH